jgi:hypothetical protein
VLPDPDAGIEWEWNLEARTSAITYFVRLTSKRRGVRSIPPEGA